MCLLYVTFYSLYRTHLDSGGNGRYLYLNFTTAKPILIGYKYRRTAYQHQQLAGSIVKFEPNRTEPNRTDGVGSVRLEGF